jgi:hypothetical protein
MEAQMIGTLFIGGVFLAFIIYIGILFGFIFNKEINE